MTTRSRKTHCIRSHALTEDNVYHPPKAPHKNLCRECIHIRDGAKPRHHPKPCADCGATIPYTGKRPPQRCAPCAESRHKAKGAEAMRALRARGYRPAPTERLWTDERVSRFWGRVRKGEGCWEWQALRSGQGYGMFPIANRHYGAHRASWEITNGPIPDGMVVRHDCDNPPCVRPDHLRIGTHQDNVMDAVERRRHQRGDDHWTRRTERQRDANGRWVVA